MYLWNDLLRGMFDEEKNLIAAIVSVALLFSLAACAPTTNKGCTSTHESAAALAKLKNNFIIQWSLFPFAPLSESVIQKFSFSEDP